MISKAIKSWERGAGQTHKARAVCLYFDCLDEPASLSFKVLLSCQSFGSQMVYDFDHHCVFGAWHRTWHAIDMYGINRDMWGAGGLVGGQCQKQERQSQPWGDNCVRDKEQPILMWWCLKDGASEWQRIRGWGQLRGLKGKGWRRGERSEGRRRFLRENEEYALKEANLHLLLRGGWGGVGVGHIERRFYRVRNLHCQKTEMQRAIWNGIQKLMNCRHRSLVI